MAITGQKFAELPLAENDDLLSSYLIVSQLSAGKPQSFKIKAANLAQQVFSQYVNALQLKSMAYESSGDYALSSHDHDVYTSAEFIPASIVDGVEVLSAQTYSLTTIKTAWHLSAKNGINHNTEYIVDKIENLQPKLGQVAFMISAVTSYTDANFIGWVLADGTSYSRNKFKLSDDIATVFKCSGTSFTVPNLSGFFKPLTQQFSLCCQHFNGQNAIAKHKHNVTIEKNNSSLSVSLDSFGQITTKFKTNTSASNGGSAVYNGKEYIGTTNVQSVADIDPTMFQNANLSTNITSSDSKGLGYSYPSNQTLKAFVYVGRLSSSPL